MEKGMTTESGVTWLTTDDFIMTKALAERRRAADQDIEIDLIQRQLVLEAGVVYMSAMLIGRKDQEVLLRMPRWHPVSVMTGGDGRILFPSDILIKAFPDDEQAIAYQVDKFVTGEGCHKLGSPGKIILRRPTA
jgi:hypothetical protein